MSISKVILDADRLASFMVIHSLRNKDSCSKDYGSLAMSLDTS